jgi:hypothetical protein
MAHFEHFIYKEKCSIFKSVKWTQNMAHLVRDNVIEKYINNAANL